MQSPASVQRLRRFILDLAVRGKLIPQDPNDEPASELLKQIAKEKARLVKAGEIKRPKKLPPIDEIPYSLPPSWHWTRIREITSDRGQRVPEAALTYIDVTSIDKKNGIVAGTKVLQANEAPSRARKVVQKGDVLYSCVRPYLLNVATVDHDFDPKPIASTAFAILNGHGLVLPRYLWIVLRSPFMVARVEEDMRGQAYPAINDTDFSILPFPLPPLAEQHRIVAKVDELMRLCDGLEAAQTERETTRTRLTAASLARLNAPDPDAAKFREHVKFALNNFTPLTTRPEQIKALRQTILNLAVRGKLVPQNPNDEPASELLQRIAKKKARLVKEGKIHKQAPLQPLDPNEALFDLPNSWTWTPSTYPTYVVSDKGKKIQTKDIIKSGKFPVVDQGKLFIRGYHNDESKVIHVKDPIILFGDHTRETKLIDFDFIVGADGVKLLQPVSIYQRYYFMALQWLPLDNRGYGRHFKLLKTSFIPIPPLPEQRRIVAKVDELMEVCDRLEMSLAGDDDVLVRLFSALLHEILGSDGTQKISGPTPIN